MGYAEADPLDVGGFDARSKLSILMKLAGLDVPEEIPLRGITEVTAADFEYARSLGSTIKLLGSPSWTDRARSPHTSPLA